VPDIGERRANRLRVMNTIFDLADGLQTTMVNTDDLRSTTGSNLTELSSALYYLKGEFLIKAMDSAYAQMPPPAVWLTHLGIKEIEKARNEPEQGSAHFPPLVSIQHFHGDVIGSSILNGSPGATQVSTTTVGDISLTRLGDFIRQWDHLEANSQLPIGLPTQAEDEVDILRAQLKSAMPRSRAIKETWHSLRTVLEGAGGLMAGTGLLEAMNQVHF